mmetsp:Transcript_8953/g.16114  ORF Transcript_8953/g.16114 Transcript_8953/m.16114 type:complete len:181 (+) Transcript_8953:91-633(+)
MGQTHCCCEPADESMVDMAPPMTVEVEGRGPKPETVDYPSSLPVPESAAEVPAVPEESETSPPVVEPEPLPEVEPAPPPPPLDAASDCFLVTVDTTTGRKLGFGVGHKPGEVTLHVVKVQDAGIIPDWNRQNPDKQVLVGSRIREINGEKVVPKEQELMMKDIADACSQPRLTFLVERRS